ncbi:MAG: hypothetical protein A2148_07280 [Chloroflexi bacterium RBG_16_68_14]|nr:MAG: hypothetical protein A2148_07280 [Chloroflexi bacterium RBG_16_68_14]
MRVLQVAPLWETVPPPAYGGTEAVVSVLCEALVRLGVDVTLCASGDSRTSARLHTVYHRSLRTAEDLADAAPYDWMHAALSLREAQGYDLIHNHAGELPMAMSHLVDVPMLTTMHCLITPDTRFVWDRYRGWYNTISDAQRRAMPPVRGGRFVGTVHNGIDVESFPFSAEKDDHLLFLARIAPDKGTHLAIEVARRLGMRLLVAGKVDRADQDYYRDVVEPLIDGEQVVFLGEADSARKRELYRRAYCLLMPLCWDEPFGLVMAEAMACGTPVVAFARGGASEIIVDGQTGYLVDDLDAMVEAVGKIERIDPVRCRRHVAEHFAPAVMAGGYLKAYRAILDQTAKRRWLAPAPALPKVKDDDREAAAIA